MRSLCVVFRSHQAAPGRSYGSASLLHDDNLNPPSHDEATRDHYPRHRRTRRPPDGRQHERCDPLTLTHFAVPTAHNLGTDTPVAASLSRNIPNPMLGVGDYATTSVGDVDTDWNSDYASKGYEYFDVWAPEIATRYGEVFWTDQGSTPLPPDIVKRFDGKVIAIQGYEQDQVMVTPTGKPGENPEQDVSVPINWAYNHHYCAWMAGKHSERKKVPTPDDVYGSGAHGMETMIASVDKEDQSGKVHQNIPNTWFISEGNGGESRKSFHGYPAGFAQLMESPTSWHITPMQIDTRNRDHGVTKDDIHKCDLSSVPRSPS